MTRTRSGCRPIKRSVIAPLPEALHTRAMTTLAPYRTGYLHHEAITHELEKFARAHPDLTRLRSIGKTDEGRDILLLVVGRAPDEARPAFFIDGNMHAMELAGSSVALAVAEDLLRVHAGEDLGLPAPVVEALRESLVYVLPRMSPDGAEAVLTSGRFVRSSPRDDLKHRRAPRFAIQDLDGDGLALLMRVPSPSGDFVESREVPNLMVPRTLDDEGPFYAMYPEALIENWDGFTVPTWGYFDDAPTDLNRNFPYFWAPEEEQVGAGLFPTSLPEARAVAELTSRTPHLMGWINLHTFGGVCIRPLGDKPDAKMNQSDLAVYRQIEQWFTEHTGYPTVSGAEEFLYEPDKPLRGDLSDYAYAQRGCLAVAVELWDLFTRAGIERKKPFVKTYEQARDELHKLAAFDQAHNHARIVRPWKKITHPQLGVVEVGGLDPRVGVWNPPYELLPEVCSKASQVFLRMIALLPRLHVEVKTTPLAGGTRTLEIIVENRGYLPTHGLWSAAKLNLSEPVAITVDGAVGEHVRTVGHLEGWGRGRYAHGGWPYQTTTGGVSRVRATFVVGDKATVRVGSPRVGFIERSV